MTAASNPGTAIEALGLSTRVRNCLTRAGLRQVHDVLQRTEDELTAVPGMGEGGVRELSWALVASGFTPPRSSPAARARSSKVRAHHANLELRQTRAMLRRLVDVVARDHPRAASHAALEMPCETCERVGEAGALLERDARVGPGLAGDLSGGPAPPTS